MFVLANCPVVHCVSAIAVSSNLVVAQRVLVNCVLAKYGLAKCLIDDQGKTRPFAFIGIGQIKTASVRQNIFSNLRDLGYSFPIFVSSYISFINTILPSVYKYNLLFICII